LVAATAKLAAGDLGARAPLVGGRSELQVLAGAFNTMAATLETRDRELRIAEEKTRAIEIELAVTRAGMEIAKQIQCSLLPEDQLSLGGVQAAGRCIPAAAVGGDYFGYFPRGAQAVDSLIGDVSGDGVGAGRLLAEARSTFLAERLAEPNAARLLSKLNDLLYEDLDRAGHFITACCAMVDAATRELSYANAGHPPALLLRAGETRWSTLNADGMPLGIFRAIDFSEVKVTLHTGDIVVFYTDGLTEARNEAGAMFGTNRLGEMVVAHRHDEPEKLVKAVLAELDRFSGVRQPDDDITIVVMKLASRPLP
jgi:sigma-B regulation protein RsbU (phosphoserine phosphatase)